MFRLSKAVIVFFSNSPVTASLPMSQITNSAKYFHPSGSGLHLIGNHLSTPETRLYARLTCFNWCTLTVFFFSFTRTVWSFARSTLSGIINIIAGSWNSPTHLFFSFWTIGSKVVVVLLRSFLQWSKRRVIRHFWPNHPPSKLKVEGLDATRSHHHSSFEK